MIITKEATIFMLRHGTEEFDEFRRLVDTSRKFKNYHKIDYSTFDKNELYATYRRIDLCYWKLRHYVGPRKLKLKFNFNNLEDERRRMNLEFQKRNNAASPRTCKRVLRQEAARKNRGNGKSKNR